MIPLSREGAKYFCQKFAGRPGWATDVRDLYDSVLDKKRSFKEGDGVYEQYRDSLLREADRSFFLAVSCFRRALDLLTASSVFWAHVSLYYCSWFAANAALGMFGCWVVGPRGKFRIIIDVQQHAPGTQEFLVQKNYSTPVGGSHQFFWHAYYRAMKSVIFGTDKARLLAVTPIANSPTWTIDRRNVINYQSSQAFKMMEDFASKFDASKFPVGLQGDFVTQFELAKTLLLFSAERAVEFGLRTDVYRKFNSRAQAIKELIYDAVPAKLSKYSEEKSLAV